MKVPSVALMRNLGLEPDPWQVEVLDSERTRILLNCSRQAGKFTVVALLAAWGFVIARLEPPNVPFT